MALSFDDLMEVLGDWAAERGADKDTALAFAYLLTGAQAAGSSMEQRVLRPSRVSLSAWRLLCALYFGGPSEPRFLAELTFYSRASVVNVLNTLQKAGYVKRAANRADHRLVTVSVTPAGIELIERCSGQWFQHLGRVLQDLTTEERRTLAALSHRVMDSARRLQAADGAGSAPAGSQRPRRAHLPGAAHAPREVADP